MKNELHRLCAVWHILATDTHLSRFVTDADLAQFKRRIEAEGISFVTVTLPALGKSLLQAFRSGVLEIPEGWSAAKGYNYPSFLHKAWSELFDKDGKGLWLVTGDGAYNPVIAAVNTHGTCMGAAVLAIRQLTELYYKYEQPWTEDQELESCSKFIAAEDDIWEVTKSLLAGGLTTTLIDGRSISIYLERAERLISKLLDGSDPKEITPRYGTGATADRATPWGRWQKPRFIEKLARVFPYEEYFFSGINGLEEAVMLSRGLDLEEVPEPTARVVHVPKDSRGPRLISAEPREFMYIQQGLMFKLVDIVERWRNVAKQVSIIDQTRNRELAQLASQTNHLATLDLESASDRVSWWLVSRLFPACWVEALDASRSESTVMPNGDEILMTKFAPMGSACCFPVESLVFWALCHAARGDYNEEVLYETLFDRCRKKDDCILGVPLIKGHLNELSVFGDDIIVRAEDVARTVALLESVGLKVNRNKSFTDGPFRESCGGDYYLGSDVVPLRVKHRLDSDELDCVYDFNTLCNSIALKYGNTEPRLIYKLRELTYSFFEVKPAIRPSGPETQVWPGYVLTDTHWMINESGQTPKPLPMQMGEDKPRWIVTNVRGRRYVAEKRKTRPSGDISREGTQPYYGAYCMRILTERPVKALRDMGWCSVLRSFCLGSRESKMTQYTFRKRVYHKLAWVQVERV
jgi:hypothetical protein